MLRARRRGAWGRALPTPPALPPSVVSGREEQWRQRGARPSDTPRPPPFRCEWPRGAMAAKGGAPFGHPPPSPLPLRVAGRSNGGVSTPHLLVERDLHLRLDVVDLLSQVGVRGGELAQAVLFVTSRAREREGRATPDSAAGVPCRPEMHRLRRARARPRGAGTGGGRGARAGDDHTRGGRGRHSFI